MSGQLLVKHYYLKELANLTQCYGKGDDNAEVLKIKEWLTLWQLDKNDVDNVLTLTTQFDDQTEAVLIEIQTFLNLKPTGVVDEQTWASLLKPFRKAFSTEHYNKHTLRQKIVYFASKHLQFRSAELFENNQGPWVRSYMDGWDGTYAYWCVGFVCTVLDQTFSSIDQRFDDYYANTYSCKVMKKHAQETGYLVTWDQLKNKQYLPQAGDMVLYYRSPQSPNPHHIEIIYDILDRQSGDMLTIGGNTNFSGSSNGVGVFLVDRNYLSKHVDIIKLKEY